MAFSAMLAGAAMSHCGAALPHGLGCPLSGHLDLPHGLTVGILQIPMLQISKPAIGEKAAWINRELKIEGEDAVEALIEKIKDLESEIGFPIQLETDFDEATLHAMVEDAMDSWLYGTESKAFVKGRSGSDLSRLIDTRRPVRRRVFLYGTGILKGKVQSDPLCHYPFTR